MAKKDEKKPDEVTPQSKIWLSVEEVAQYLNVTSKQIYNLLQGPSDRIPASKKVGPWRFNKDEVDTWLKEPGEEDFLDRANEVLAEIAMGERSAGVDSHDGIGERLEATIKSLIGSLRPNPVELVSLQYFEQPSRKPVLREVGRIREMIADHLTPDPKYRAKTFKFLSGTVTARWQVSPLHLRIFRKTADMETARALPRVVTVSLDDIERVREEEQAIKAGQLASGRDDQEFRDQLLRSNSHIGDLSNPEWVEQIRDVLVYNTHNARQVFSILGDALSEWNLVFSTVALAGDFIGGWVIHSKKPLSSRTIALVQLGMASSLYALRASMASPYPGSGSDSVSEL